jgi:uncharacterized protein (TIGR02594 family)
MDNPLIMGMLHLDNKWPEHDEVPWCSAFVNWIAWLLRLPRSKSLAARSWLLIGLPVPLTEARPGFDVVVLNRAGGVADASVIASPGHVGFFAGIEGGKVLVLGGNQGNSVTVSAYSLRDVLGVRRLYG